MNKDVYLKPLQFLGSAKITLAIIVFFSLGFTGCTVIDPSSYDQRAQGFLAWYQSKPVTIQNQVKTGEAKPKKEEPKKEEPPKKDPKKKDPKKKEPKKDTTKTDDSKKDGKDSQSEEQKKAESDKKRGDQSTNKSDKEVLEKNKELADKKAEQKEKEEEAKKNPADTEKKAAAEKAKVEADKIAAELKAYTDAFKTKYNEQIKADLDRRKKEINSADGWNTRTTAAFAFVPRLKAVQPALVQSFSLRNFLQVFNAESDPDDIRKFVKKELRLDPIVEINPRRQDPSKPPVLSNEEKNKVKSSTEGYYDTSVLNTTEFDLLANSMAEVRLNERAWWTKENIISLDIGLTSPALSVGEGDNEFFESRVDSSFPQFLFGAGLHFDSFEISGGLMIYKSEISGSLKDTFYVSLAIDLYSTNLGKASNVEAGN